MARLSLPTPPEWLRRGPLREGAFRSSLHDERTASLIGTALGIAFATAFLTGLLSHELQLRHPPAWIPDRPVWIYRFTQGLHVASGLAAIPLLLAKLWTVYPRLFGWPPVKSVLHALERLSIAVLVAGAIFELVTGLLNVVQWYPWKFAFVPTHYWVAWITVGALILHIAVKAPAIARGYRRPVVEAADQEPAAVPEPALAPEPASVPEPALASASASASASAPAPVAVPDRGRGATSRRALLLTTGAAVGVVTLTTVGQSVTWLRGIDLLAPRDPVVGPQGVPINRTAAQAGVLTSAFAPDWRLSVAGPRPFQLTLDQLGALPQYEAVLPISCVEGWSVNGRWQGVRLVDLLDRVAAPPGADIRFVSLEKAGFYATTTMPREYARDPLTLLALRLGGQRLSIDHGYPARIIAPGRPGVLQTKWVTRIEVL
jgi:DMSO/TMAO reductase YedYZ molybdopterin-dependent catalytic subunit